MRSLRSRILLTASLVLVVFLGCASILLDRVFRDSALNGVEDRLRGSIFMLIGAADFDALADSELIRALPDPSLSVPASGHYARIFTVAEQVLWSSASLLGISIPPPSATLTGEWRLDRTRTSSGEELFALSYGIIWEGRGDRAPRAFTIQAFENEKLYVETVHRFRRSLWLWFGGLSLAFLLVQGLNLNWGLKPLSSIDDEVRAIERGEREQIVGSYPLELSSLARNLNRLLMHNRESLKRYRNSLGDLAHSIKTPLAVLRNEVDGADNSRADKVGAGNLTPVVREQIERIDRTVQYYLQRPSAGRALMLPPLAIAPLVERVVASLRKVHAERGLAIETTVSESIAFPADEGDLMEIVGNLCDNACKWARSRVAIEVSAPEVGNTAVRRLRIVVRDDGPGIPADRIASLTQRGTRLDESVEGQGFGLAIVRETVEDVYGGKLTLSSDTAGTLVCAELCSA